MMARAKAVSATPGTGLAWTAAALTAVMLAGPVAAQTFPNLPITPGQRATAQQVAQAGVPLSELAPNAPDSHTIKSGDTLWAIAGLFLRSPWRWPELWGMNMDQVRNPHLIFPGQHLVLEKVDGRARLRMGQPSGDNAPTETIRVSPRSRITPLADSALPTLNSNLIEPFLAEPVIVAEGVMERAPRIVAAPEGRVMITKGDRTYARGTETPLAEAATDRENAYRVFRNATPLRDPVTRAVLGYEAQFLGRAALVRGESRQSVTTRDGVQDMAVPATLDILSVREEIRVGDRLLPEPPRQLANYVPHAPRMPITGASIVSMYGNAVGMAGQNQVVVINKGTADGIESGHVLTILKDGQQFQDRTDAKRDAIKLPDERNGLLMVFRPFERLYYALILESPEGVRVGNRLASPR